MITPSDIYEESKGWNLEDHTTVLVFCDWIEEKGNPDYAWTVRTLLKQIQRDGQDSWADIPTFIREIRDYVMDYEVNESVIWDGDWYRKNNLCWWITYWKREWSKR